MPPTGPLPVPSEVGGAPPSPTGTSPVTPPTAGVAAPPTPRIETDSLGIRWAVSPDGYRVSIPKSVPDSAAAAYAGPKLAEQAQIHSNISRPQTAYRPSEKAATMSAPRRVVPEQEAMNWQEEAQRNRSILSDPRATPDDIRVAQSRLQQLDIIRRSYLGGAQ